MFGAPFPHISTHIVDAQLVGSFGADGMAFVGRIMLMPRHSVRVVATAIFVAVAIAISR